jgi:hypothetical protein
MAVLALYWESNHSRSLIDVEHHNELSMLYQRISMLESQMVKAKEIISGLRAQDFGSANEPLFSDLRDFDSYRWSEMFRPKIPPRPKWANE